MASTSNTCIGKLSAFSKCSYKWTISDFCLSCAKKGDSITSPKFSVFIQNVIHECQLQLYPAGDKRDSSSGYMSLYLNNVKKTTIELNFKLSILNGKHEVIHYKQWKKVNYDANNHGWGLVKFVEIDFISRKLSEELKDRQLKVLCEIAEDSDNSVDFNKLSSLLPASIQPQQQNGQGVLNDLEMLFEGGELSDVRFKVNEEEFNAHKCILIGRSPIFKAMFQHNMRENQTNEVEIEDVKSNVFKELLRFVYVGKVIGIQKIADDLLAAADKYSISGLMLMCEESLCKDLSVNNVTHRLCLADLHSAVTLKTKSIEFVVKNAKALRENAEYKEFIHSGSRVAGEIIMALTV